jgi:predicted CXXCH cytochrome family protein
MPSRYLFVFFAVALLAGVVAPAAGMHRDAVASDDQPAMAPHATATVDENGIEFVTSAVCASCHQVQYDDWLQSQHRHAMEHADDMSVRGDFDDAVVVRDDETVTFHRDGDAFRITVEGADGQVSGHEVLYAFGWDPLQQYLIAQSDGRLQAFDIAWDTEQSRWFDLYPDEIAAPGDPFHWQGLQQNWNFMCADCHSTGLVRNYDPATDSFATTWAEETIGCESCHGAGGAHVGWAEGRSLPADMDPASMGLLVDVATPEGAWLVADGNAIAHWEGPPRTSTQLAVCGSCHARRRLLGDMVVPGTSMLDAFIPSLLDADLYRPDGRQEDEVYILGSFLQSKMAAAGVVCSDCHQPHSARLVAQGNAVCTQCHVSEVFDTPEHHHHEADTKGAACVSCHMPEDLYMEVDWRRDHGFRVPSAVVAAIPGVVDSCATCHDARTAWDEAQAHGWWKDGSASDIERASAIALGEERGVGAATALSALAADVSQPPIFRATALSLLSSNFQPSAIAGLTSALRDADPLVRLGAIRGLAGLSPADRFQLLAPLIDDPAKAVRIEVASALSDVPLSEVPPEQAERLSALFEEMVAVESLFLDRPEDNYNIANHAAYQGDAAGAERGYEAALARDPTFVPAYVNLAELQRSTAGEAASIATLRRGLEAVPDAPGLRYALGLALYRQGDLPGALAELETAWRQGDGEGHYAYAYALALDESGEGRQAITILEASRQAHPNDRDILYALIYYLSEAGETEKALQHAHHLAALEPEDPTIAELLRRLGG